ncbi:MAG: mannonate dehydratase [Christensenellales bacterium]|jgi:mannonate dehydratase
MKMTFRWYGKSDPVTLDKIRQIPVIDGIVSSLYHIKPGEVWAEEEIRALKGDIEDAGLNFEVVESVPVVEDIKLGAPERDKYIDNYITTIKRLGKEGIKVVCYNFMPVFDWLRTDLRYRYPDGSLALSYDNERVLKFNPLTIGDELNLPAWDKSITRERLVELLEIYKDFTLEKYFANIKYFLDAIIPHAEQAGVKMAIHPDDPPWSIFNLPRIIGNKDNLRKFLDLNKSAYNGITFCTGSFGCNKENDLADMIKMCQGRIHFAHLRNVLITGFRCFTEAAHPTNKGSLDMYEIVKALVDTGFDGYVRPDHGRAIWGEEGTPGYGLYDRALGAMYISGLFEAVEKGGKNVKR